jgi:DNA-binding protein HU-beta
MNKSQLIDAIAAEAGLTKADSKKAVDAYVKVIAEALKANDKIALVGFGSFAVVERSARTGRNPKTKEVITIAEKRIVRFKPGSELTDSIQ